MKTPSPAVCEVLGRSGVDLVCLDAEHAPFDRRDIDNCVLACRAVQLPCLVRVPAAKAEHILSVLDVGADGIIAPHMKNAEDARYVAGKAHYHTGRGFAGGTRASGAKGMAEHVADSAASTVVVGQIEDVEALDNIDAILDVDGIDCFFIGRSDLTISMGLTDRNDPRVLSAIEDICRRAKKRGRITGTFTADLDELPHWRSLGVSLFLLGSDQGFMASGAKSFGAQVREKL
ncbi:MAG: HpcH/HpaI aldolase family protein [Maricaulaceae bacterium]